MNMSNRFEIEGLARKQEEAIRRNLRHAGHVRDFRADAAALARRSNVRTGLIVALTTVLSAVMALGLSAVMSFAFGVLR